MAETPASPPVAYRASVLHFRGDPGANDAPDAMEYFADGLLVVADGKVAQIGPHQTLLPSLLPETSVVDYSGKLIVPGFIDTHVHYPQIDGIAAPGRQLLDWLEHYTFPLEGRFGDTAYARETAEFFLDELLRNGTTSALVFGTVHKASADEFFAASLARDLRMIAGKVLMDRNCPETLRDSAESAYDDSAELIERWDGRGRLNYAITPRFAITSTPEQMQQIGRLAADYPSVRIQSHVAENADEIAWVRELYPQHRSYLDVYDSFGLLRPGAVYAHCIHLDAADRQRMAGSGAAAAFCPTSNLFLGSGLFDIEATDEAGMKFSVATDVGGGTSMSMLRTLGEAYKVARLHGQYLSPLRAFYLATLGGARALGLEHCIGSFAPGMEADFVVLDETATPLGARRSMHTNGLTARLLGLIILGDERCVSRTYVRGRAVAPP